MANRSGLACTGFAPDGTLRSFMRLLFATVGFANVLAWPLPCRAAEPPPEAAEPPPVAAEPPPVAAELYRAGTQAFDRGDFQAAALSFEQAYEHAPEPATAYSAALSWFNANNRPRAADAYERAFAEGSLDQERSTQARARFEALRNQLGIIRVLAPIGERASLGYQSAALIPFSVYVLPGQHQATLVTGKDQMTERMRVAAGEIAVIRFSALRAPPRTSTPRKAPLADTAAVDTGPSAWWGVAALGVAAASVGGALVFRAQALESVDRFEDTHENSARDDALTERALSYGFWGLAGVSAAAGVTILAWPSGKESPAGAAVTWTGSGVHARIRF